MLNKNLQDLLLVETDDKCDLENFNVNNFVTMNALQYIRVIALHCNTTIVLINDFAKT